MNQSGNKNLQNGSTSRFLQMSAQMGARFFKGDKIGESILFHLLRELEKGNTLLSIDELKEKLNDTQIHKKILGSETGFVGQANDNTPVLLDGNFLQIRKTAWQEQFIYQEFIRKSTACNLFIDEGEIQNLITSTYFFDIDNWKKLAILHALKHQFTVITGGPGSGKTYSLGKLISILLKTEKGSHLNVVLAAPTGKAAARMNESLSEHRQEWEQLPHENRPQDAQTLHRLIGTAPYRLNPHYNAKNKLPADIVVVDEASMIDLGLMIQLLNALKNEAVLILLGDHNQLASVDAGAILGDVCQASLIDLFHELFISDFNQLFGTDKAFLSSLTITKENSPKIDLANSIIELKESRRYESSSVIGRLDKAIKNQDVGRFVNLLNSTSFQLEIDGFSEIESLITYVTHRYIQPALKGADVDELFRFYSEFQIICSRRFGPLGYREVNSMILSRLNVPDKWFHGYPIMIQRNDHRLGLYNGDIGIFIKEDGKFYFQNGSGKYVKYEANQLQNYETAFAITIHKSQGSEFKKVLIVLDNDSEERLLRQELIYTAVTRAQSDVAIFAKEKATTIKKAIQTPTVRNTKLKMLIEKA